VARVDAIHPPGIEAAQLGGFAGKVASGFLGEPVDRKLRCAFECIRVRQAEGDSTYRA
jgi:hypothetical protein